VGNARKPGGQVTPIICIATRIACESGFRVATAAIVVGGPLAGRSARKGAMVASPSERLHFAAAAASARKRASYGCALPTTNHIEPFFRTESTALIRALRSAFRYSSGFSSGE